MNKILEIGLASVLVIGAGVAMIAAWIFTVFLLLIPFILKVGILAGVVYVFLKLFGVL